MKLPASPEKTSPKRRGSRSESRNRRLSRNQPGEGMLILILLYCIQPGWATNDRVKYAISYPSIIVVDCLLYTWDPIVTLVG